LNTTELEILGREAELRLIAERLEGELPAATVVEGEPGIGKTTVWRAALDMAAGKGFRIVSCAPADAEARLAYAALRDLLEPAVLAGTIDELPAPQRRALEVALLRAEPEGAGPEDGAVAAATLAVLRRLAEREPLLVAVDDAQWLDASSAAVIGFCVRRLRSARIALLFAQRPGNAGPPIALARAAPNGRVARIRLDGLSYGAIRHLILPHGPFPRPVVRRIHETSGGNPFFALQLAQAVQERGERGEAGQPLPIPEELDELVGSRLAALDAGVSAELLAAALQPAPTVRTLRLTSAEPERVVSRLEEAEEAGVVRIDGEKVRFAHPLLAAGVVRSASATARREQHGRLAAVARDPEERARQLALAAPGPDEDVASALDEAAELAAGRGAPDAAVELVELAVRATPDDDLDGRTRRTIALGEHLFRVGRFSAAEELARGLVAELPAGPARARALALQGRTREDDLERAVALYEEALAGTDGDRALEADLHRYLSEAWIALGDIARSVGHARLALGVAERAGDSRRLANAIADISHLENLTAEETPGLLEQGIALEEELGELPPYYRPSIVLGLRLMFACRLDEARALLERGLADAERLGDEYLRSNLLMHLAQLEVRAGRWERAEHHAEQGAELADDIGAAQAAALLYARTLVAAHRGREAEARSAAERALDACDLANDAVFRLHVAGALGLLELSLGDAAAAVGHLGPLPRIYAERGYGQPNLNPYLGDLIEALVALGELEEAASHVAWLEERGRALDNPWALAAAARGAALLAAARGDLDGGLAAISRALGQHERLPQPFDRARDLLALGAIERRSKRRSAARTSLGRARDLFESLGATLWAARARDELARVSGRSAAGAELTPTEERVARLVAAGRSNKEVASALFVSVKAVEANLSRIYAKLGVRSRTELAHRLQPKI
jgi:DNA-binding CsgD family transcriptional regulator